MLDYNVLRSLQQKVFIPLHIMFYATLIFQAGMIKYIVSIETRDRALISKHKLKFTIWSTLRSIQLKATTVDAENLSSFDLRSNKLYKTIVMVTSTTNRKLKRLITTKLR